MNVLEWLFLILCDAAEPWQLGSQDAATPMMQGIMDLHHDIFFFLILILVFVLRILVRALWHFRSSDRSLTFDSYTIPEDDLELGQSRLLEVDNRVVVPAKTHLRIIVTSADVLHSWAVPSSGVKCDAVPGRLNQISVSVQREGVYYGQCSEICGTNHAFTHAPGNIGRLLFLCISLLLSLYVGELLFPGNPIFSTACEGLIRSPSGGVDLAPRGPPQPPVLDGVPLELPAAPPVIPELSPPLMPDGVRMGELLCSLRVNFLGKNAWGDYTRLVDMVYQQALIEKRIQDALVRDGYHPVSILAKRASIRDVIFYRGNGEALSGATLNRYIEQINTSGTRGSIPFQKVIRAIRAQNILL